MSRALLNPDGFRYQSAMTDIRRSALVLFVLLVLVSACAKRAPRPAAAPVPATASLLFVQAARGVSFNGSQLTLRGVSPTTLFFSDRPQRIAGHVLTQRFLDDWSKGADSFAQDPPNATLSVLGGRAVADAVLELSRPRLHGDDLVYDARVVAGTPPGRGGPASLFIDAETNVVVPGMLGRPPVRRPFAWDTYVYDPNLYGGGLPPPSTAGEGPYGDLTTPEYYGKNPYSEGYSPPPPRAYTFE